MNFPPHCCYNYTALQINLHRRVVLFTPPSGFIYTALQILHVKGRGLVHRNCVRLVNQIYLCLSVVSAFHSSTSFYNLTNDALHRWV